MIVASAALLVAALVGARRLRSSTDSGLEHVLTVSLLLVSGVLVLSLAAGLPGFYRPLPLLTGAIVLALLVAWVDRVAPPGTRDCKSEQKLRLRESPSSLLRLARREPLAAIAVGLAALALLNRALMAVLLQPGRFDELAYHLLFVGDWVQRGEIGGSELQRSTCCAWYPANAEVTYGWLAVFVHSDRLVGLAQIGFLVVAGLATASIARSVGAPARYATIAGSLFVLTPVALRQASTNLVDVALAAGVLVTTAFAVRIVTAPRPHAADLVRFALAAAVTVGIKASALVYVAVAAAVLAGYALRDRTRAPADLPWRRVLQAAALVAVFLVLGSGWYVRAWVATGSPVWPYRVEVLDRVVFAGPKDPAHVNPSPAALGGVPPVLHAPRSWLHDLDVGLSLRREPYDPNARLGGLGLVWLFVGIPGAVAALVISLGRRDARFALFALMVAPGALLSTPDPWFSRFVIPLAAVGVVGYAYTVWRLPSLAANAVTAAALALSVIGVVETRPLAGMERVLNTPGAPLERPPALLDERGYGPLHDLPANVRVGVVAGNPMLPYLVLGSQFSRTVVVLRRRPESPEELERFMETRGLEYLVTRARLPRSLAGGARLTLVDEASGAVAYRRAGAGAAGADDDT